MKRFLTDGHRVRRYQVLVKSPKGKDMDDKDVFAFNNKFTDRQRKIKMSLLVTKVSTDA